ncbi:MAG: hypothetical protein V3S33_03965 [Gammaproteobacteria bacterium]
MTAATKITTPEMEVALARWFDYRMNLIVPNVYWGFSSDMHECDLLIVSKAGYCTEVEIKITRADLRRDAKKSHGHENKSIKYLYFALPDYLEHCQEFVPERAGIILVRPDVPDVWSPRCKRVRQPQCQKHAAKMSDSQRYKVARLGALRIWNLKEKQNE